MGKLTVGIFSPMFSEVNGTAKASRQLAFSLAKAGAEVHVYAPVASRFKTPLSNLLMHDIRSIRLSGDPEVHMAWPLEKFFKAHDFSYLDITHSTSVETMGLLGMNAAKFNGHPKVVTHHSPFSYYLKEYTGAFFGGFLNQWVPDYERYIYHQYDLISTPTMSKKQLLLKWGYTKKPIIAISNGIESKYFKKVDGDEVKEKYHLKNKRLLVYASRMSPEKNIQKIVRIFPKILERVPDCHLALVGTGPEVKPTKELVISLGLNEHVTVTGFVDFVELLQWYKAAYMTCIWSFVEAQGLVILEAMAQGTPTVGADADGIKDTIIDNSTGYLAKNIDDFINKVVYLFENEDIRNKFGKNALIEIQNHRIDNIAKAWLAVYEKMISIHPWRGGSKAEEAERRILLKKIIESFAKHTPAISY
jgi:1,2-diacylglycerol 3-alpha-glucosyltransferase